MPLSTGKVDGPSAYSGSPGSLACAGLANLLYSGFLQMVSQRMRNFSRKRAGDTASRNGSSRRFDLPLALFLMLIHCRADLSSHCKSNGCTDHVFWSICDEMPKGADLRANFVKMDRVPVVILSDVQPSQPVLLYRAFLASEQRFRQLYYRPY